MCKALEYVKEFNQLFNKIEEEYEKARQKMRLHDLEQQDVLHKIEGESFSASEGYNLARELKRIRMDRREAKQEEDTLRRLMNSFVEGAKENLEKSSLEIETRDNILSRQKEGKIYIPRTCNGEIIEKERIKVSGVSGFIDFIPNAIICNSKSSLYNNEIMVLGEQGNCYECIFYNTHDKIYLKQEINKKNVKLMYTI